MKITQRAFVSFDELCPYECKYCYTYGIKREKIRTTQEIVNSIAEKKFDVIYVSQKNDNFANPLKGLDLCRQLFQKYRTNIFIITRNVFNDSELVELEKLKADIGSENKQIFIAVSLNAIDSIDICENTDRVCSPKERIEFLKKLSDKGFTPILMLRPIFPDTIIPVEECLQIIDRTHSYISCVVSSGLGVNQDILDRLGINESQFSYNQNQEYLQGAIDCEIKFINVDYEIQKISQKCQSLKIPMFEHSMPALNYLLESYNE